MLMADVDNAGGKGERPVHDKRKRSYPGQVSKRLHDDGAMLDQYYWGDGFLRQRPSVLGKLTLVIYVVKNVSITCSNDEICFLVGTLIMYLR